MTLVTYSDSEASDSEPNSKTETVNSRKPPGNTSKSTFQPLVDRGNPRKIVVSLPDTKSDGGAIGKGGLEDEGPARKRPRVGEGSSFAGFNSLLPAPKRAATAHKEAGKKASESSKPRVFNLKTSAAPGFERGGDAEPIQESYNEYGEFGNNDDLDASRTAPDLNKAEEPKIQKKGNAMMFKPLSVARNKTKKKTLVKTRPKADDHENPQAANEPLQVESENTTSRPPPKVDLFGLSSGGNTAPSVATQPQDTHYEPLVYKPSSEQGVSGPQMPPDTASSDIPTSNDQTPQSKPTSASSQSLASIGSDLNLSRSEMRQLLGRKGEASSRSIDTSSAGPKVLTFNTDEEYKSNASFLASISEAELAAQQHNPVRAIAPGKHSLQQLVNAASNQREALEESFASGKRNKKEAGSKYGW